MSDGSRSIDLATPVSSIDFEIFLDMAMYLMLFTQNEDMRKTMKTQFIKHWEKKEERG